jgi:hypothetical protein
MQVDRREHAHRPDYARAAGAGGGPDVRWRTACNGHARDTAVMHEAAIPILARYAVAGLFAAALSTATASDCRARLLAELGWQLQNGAAYSVHGGVPCTRADLAAAREAGDLRAVLPADAQSRDAALDALLVHDATRCAFAMRLGEATRRATTRLSDNRGYRFSSLQGGWISFGLRGAQAAGWQPVRSFGRGFMPLGGNWQAIDAFYAGRVRSECGVGRQIAQYAAQAELYGEAFDEAFAAEEIVIGTFRQLHGTRSVLLGSGAGELVRDGLARRAAADGRQAFAGLPGVLVHSLDRSTVDDSNNQAQNFVVHEVSEAAAAALRDRGGFAHYNARNRELWEISRTLDLPGLRGFQRLLNENVPSAHARLSPASRERVAQMQALLADPFYSGFEIYVHPQGIRPIGWHVVRMLDRNPRTPFQVELTMHNLHTTLYQRWLQHWLQHCRATAASVANHATEAASS